MEELANLRVAGEAALQLRIMEDWDAMRPLRPDWEALLDDSASRTIFLTWEWLKSWWDAYGDSRQLFFLTGWEAGGRLTGIAPLYRARGRDRVLVPIQVLHLVGDGSTDSDNLDFIVRRGMEATFLRTLLDWLAQHAGVWDVLELNMVPAESRIGSTLESEAAARQWRCWRSQSEHAVLPLPDSWESYLAQVSKNMRSAIGLKLRRLEKRHEVRLRRCENLADLPRSLECLFELHTRRWQLRKERGSFLLPERRKFYLTMATEFLKREWLDFWLLDLDDQTVAAEFGFRYGETYFFLQSGFDSDYASESVGFILKALILRELIQHGMRYYDFLGGADPYKQRWGAEMRSYLHLSLARPRSLGAIYLGVGRSTERSKAWLRARLPEPAREFLRRIRNFGTNRASASAKTLEASESEHEQCRLS